MQRVLAGELFYFSSGQMLGLMDLIAIAYLNECILRVCFDMGGKSSLSINAISNTAHGYIAHGYQLNGIRQSGLFAMTDDWLSCNKCIHSEIDNSSL